MGLNSQKTTLSHLYIIENSATLSADFAQKLAAETRMNVRHFSKLKSVLRADAPQIILVDLKTIGDAEAIGSLKARFTAPIIVLSDRPSMASAVKVMRAGACDFFPKPASIGAIATRIGGLLARNVVSANEAAVSSSAPAITPFWEQERDIIESALTACNGNISRAAAALQISPSTIYRKKQSWDERLGG